MGLRVQRAQGDMGGPEYGDCSWLHPRRTLGVLWGSCPWPHALACAFLSTEAQGTPWVTVMGAVDGEWWWIRGRTRGPGQWES